MVYLYTVTKHMEWEYQTGSSEKYQKKTFWYNIKTWEVETCWLRWINNTTNERTLLQQTMKTINDYELLVNINEAMFSSSTKSTNNWSLKGKESKLKNIWFLNSDLLIISITSHGDVFAAETSRSVYNKLIIQFLEELEIFMIKNFEISIDKWLFIVDSIQFLRIN